MFDCKFGLWLSFRRRREYLANSPVHRVTSAAEQRHADLFAGRDEGLCEVYRLVALGGYGYTGDERAVVARRQADRIVVRDLARSKDESRAARPLAP